MITIIFLKHGVVSFSRTGRFSVKPLMKRDNFTKIATLSFSAKLMRLYLKQNSWCENIMKLKTFYFSFLIFFSCISSVTYSQMISFYPEVDTIWVGGGCTPPVIVCSNLMSTSVRDSLTIEPGWNTDMWVEGSVGYREFIDKSYFIACDSLDQFEYEIWYQSLSPSSIISLLVPFDSSFICEISQFKLKLVLMYQDRVIDSLSQFFDIRIGIGVQGEEFSTFPTTFCLSQNYPNPFNVATDIRYQISDSRYRIREARGKIPIHTTLKLYNILGQEVRTLVSEPQEVGYYTVTWDGRDSQGRNVPSGVYFYKFSLNGSLWSETKRMVLLR